MSKIVLTVQKFDGLDDIPMGRFEPNGTTQISSNQWEVSDPLLLWDIRSEVSGYSNTDFTFIPFNVFSTLVRRFTGACSEALKNNSGWKCADSLDLEIQQESGKTLRDYGLMATRYNGEREGDTSWHVSIDLKFKDGTVITVPSKTEIMWSSAPFIVAHLNKIEFQGGHWVDKSSWAWADHLLSHGH